MDLHNGFSARWKPLKINALRNLKYSMLVRKWETKGHKKFNFYLVYLEVEGVNFHRCGLLLRKHGPQAFSSTFQEEKAGESCMYKPDDRSTYAR